VGADFSTYTMLDSVDTNILFANAGPAHALAGYMDGSWPTWDQIAPRYGKSGKFLLSIDVTNQPVIGAQALDIENGDASVGDAPGWAKATAAAGKKAKDLRYYPKLYCSIGMGESLVTTCTRAGVKRNTYMYWSAHYGAGPHICGPKTCGAAVQADATQWTDTYLGLNLDASLCYGYFFAGPPVVPPHGPVRRIAIGTQSLDQFLAASKLSLIGMLEASAANLNLKHLRALVLYLGQGTGTVMPKGLVFWTAA
jgi:hypothetical protein